LINNKGGQARPYSLGYSYGNDFSLGIIAIEVKALEYAH
jgi:hypothetical protein